jgi:hypothetical protein
LLTRSFLPPGKVVAGLDDWSGMNSSARWSD